jgi:hypothetical protein
LVERLVYQELHHVNGTDTPADQQDQVGKGSVTYER